MEVYLHAALTRITGLTGIFSPIATRRLIKFIEGYQPDVIHIHELHAYFVNHIPLMEYIKSKGIKTVWTFHCEYMYTGKCGHAYECEQWKTECRRCPHLRDYPKSLLIDRTSKMFCEKKRVFSDWEDSMIITPSKWLADRVGQSFLADKRIEIIHNGIDAENVFYPREFLHLKARHGLTNEKIILAVAPDLMSQRKGGRYVVELAERLKKENIKFILIGVSDLTEAFPDNVIALGRTENQAELAEYYSMADLFVICSEKETFSMTCVESLACGTPVVGFYAGAPETIFEKPYAVFGKYGDMETLLKNVIDRINLKTEISENCSHYIIQNFSIEKTTKDIMSLY